MADLERPRVAHADQARAAIAGAGQCLAATRLGGLAVDIRLHDGAAWIVLRRPDHGGLALRMPFPGEGISARLGDGVDAMAAIELTGEAGDGRLVLKADPFDLELIKATLTFTARREVRLGRLPRDIVPFDRHGEPGGEGRVEAAQREFNTAFLYFSFDRPEFGKVLYLQDLTSLNAWFATTDSSPAGVVGGDWPDIGYAPPVAENSGLAVIPQGTTVTMYDTILCVRRYPQDAEDQSAWQFLDMLGAAYCWLSRPEPRYRDWQARARATIHDLEQAPEARISHYGHTYFHPYTASEYPDAMVQLSLASALQDWSRLTGEPQPLVDEVLAGLDRFYDEGLGILRRYLPNVGPDKDRDAVDSWYLYHPLLNLSNLALAGHREARRLFIGSMDYAIRAARHFAYKWPIMYNIRDFSVIRAVAEADQRGQTDVGGIYAWVMLQAYELTFEERYLKEACAAIEAARGMRFNLNYQANLTAWGAAACIRLWRITNAKQHLAQSYVYLASFFHNCQMWKSELGFAVAYSNFLGATCLQDARYMAAYECFDSFAAFERYLDYGGPDLIPSVKLLLGEYCAHALDRAWYYYPDALPDGALAERPRNGYIQPGLNFPVEDLYASGEQAGQVGQEIYGGGAAMVFAAGSCRRVEGAPFVLWCDHFVRAMHRFDEGSLSLKLDGHQGTRARLVLVTDDPGAFVPRLRTSTGAGVAFGRTVRGWEARVPANATLELGWREDS